MVCGPELWFLVKRACHHLPGQARAWRQGSPQPLTQNLEVLWGNATSGFWLVWVQTGSPPVLMQREVGS